MENDEFQKVYIRNRKNKTYDFYYKLFETHHSPFLYCKYVNTIFCLDFYFA